MRKSQFCAFAVSLALVLTMNSITLAAVPSQITVQGRLTNPSGVPAPAGTKTFTFRIFDAAIGGAQIWPAIGGEIQSVTTDANGLWTARIGILNPLSDDFFTGVERWLEISVDDGINPPETLSRMKINSNAFAYRIGSVDGAEGGKLTSKLSVGTTHTNTGIDAFAAGSGNVVAGDYSTAPGGNSNWAFDDFTAVGGGEQNRAIGTYTFIGGGLLNQTLGGTANTIVGGYDNHTESADFSSIGGGQKNLSTAEGAVVGGGGWNSAVSAYAVVGGGGGPTTPDRNLAGADFSVIAGGRSNKTSGNGSVIGGGVQNDTRRFCATIAGGFLDTASGDFATIGGGLYNATWEYAAVVSGGQSNNAAAAYATVPGGQGNHAYGQYSFAAGRRARAGDGTFVWADITDADFPATGDPNLTGPFNRQFLARSTGGATIVTGVDPSGFAISGVTVPAGSGSWSTLSDRASKSDIELVDPAAVLARLADLPISSWRYKSQADSIRHMGPMAQDFHEAFGIGEDERHISTVDADGVALAAIRALYELSKQQAAEIDELRREVSKLRKADE